MQKSLFKTENDPTPPSSGVPLDAIVSKPLDSVYLGKDNALLDALFSFYAPSATEIIDVCCNGKKMWKKSAMAGKIKYYDIDEQWEPDHVCAWDMLPDDDATVDVLVYDPPHLPLAAASPKSMARYAKEYGLGLSVKGDNVGQLHLPFLHEAKRVLKRDGLIFAKIKDYIHNHKYQWNLELFNQAVRLAGMTPCDLIIKKDPCGGNLKSGRWKRRVHAKNVHCYWVIIRNGRCEPRRKAC